MSILKKIGSLCFTPVSMLLWQSKSRNYVNFSKLLLRNKVVKLYSRLIGYKWLKLKSNRKSDTAFVFGAGESISTLTPEQWEKISKHDTFATNFAMLHPFEFDYVFFEAVPNKSLKELADECIKSKRSQVVLSLNYAIWAGLYKHYANFTSYNFCAYLPVFLRTNKVEEFISWKRKIKQKSHGIDRIDNHCTHVGSVVDFAVLSGYKNIVLVGVDLNGGKYFTEVENEDISAETEKRYVTYNKARVSFLKEKGQYDAKLHPSMMKNDTLTAYDYFKTMQKELESNGIRLSVSSKNSLLSDFLPIADI